MDPTLIKRPRPAEEADDGPPGGGRHRHRLPGHPRHPGLRRQV